MGYFTCDRTSDHVICFLSRQVHFRFNVFLFTNDIYCWLHGCLHIARVDCTDTCRRTTTWTVFILYLDSQFSTVVAETVFHLTSSHKIFVNFYIRIKCNSRSCYLTRTTRSKYLRIWWVEEEEPGEQYCREVSWISGELTTTISHSETEYTRHWTCDQEHFIVRLIDEDNDSKNEQS